MATRTETPLIETLKTLPGETLLSDGATTWDVYNLIDALREAAADTEGPITTEYVVGYTEEGRVTVSQLDGDGYIMTPPAYVQPEAR